MADKPQLEGLKSAVDVAKQLISLSTGVVALTVTFLEKIVSKDLPRTVPTPLKWAWGGYALTILFGCMTLMAITGTLAAYDRKANGLPLNSHQVRSTEGYESNIRIPALAMILCFVASLILTILTGIALF
jgi:hypothetical protein